jgi:hypothetical protein
VQSKRLGHAKIKVGTMLKASSVQKLKALSASEGRSISDLLDEAIEEFRTSNAYAAKTQEERLHNILHPGWTMTLAEIMDPVEDEMYGE